MDTKPPGTPGPQADAALPVRRGAWHGIRARILGGLLLVLPVLITFWMCVYVPTAPMPASGFIMLVPEEEVTELGWSPEQTLQVLVSIGLTAPREVPYFKAKPVSGMDLAAARASGDVPRIRPDERQPPTA